MPEWQRDKVRKDAMTKQTELVVERILRMGIINTVRTPHTRNSAIKVSSSFLLFAPGACMLRKH
jgi:hypothetical protein